jgi:hypothetical protein
VVAVAVFLVVVILVVVTVAVAVVTLSRICHFAVEIVVVAVGGLMNGLKPSRYVQ